MIYHNDMIYSYLNIYFLFMKFAVNESSESFLAVKKLAYPHIWSLLIRNCQPNVIRTTER